MYEVLYKTVSRFGFGKILNSVDPREDQSSCTMGPNGQGQHASAVGTVMTKGRQRRRGAGPARGRRMRGGPAGARSGKRAKRRNKSPKLHVASNLRIG